MLKQKVLVTPWGERGQPSEVMVRRLFADENLQPYRWSNGPHDAYGAHTHPFNKVIIVVEGSITFGLPLEKKELLLHAGDRLDLPEGVLHNAVVGPNGVVCLEAHY